MESLEESFHNESKSGLEALVLKPQDFMLAR